MWAVVNKFGTVIKKCGVVFIGFYDKKTAIRDSADTLKF